MVSAQHEPITAVWRQNPQRVPGAEPVVSDEGKAQKLNVFFSFAQPDELGNFS